MNSNLDRYLRSVETAASHALKFGQISLSSLLPCTVCRELEVPSNPFVDSSDPFLVSYRTLTAIRRLVNPSIPRKIEFGSAVYLKEGVIDRIFPNSPVTLIFVGDGNSDKRFAYNSHRLFSTFQHPYRLHCFIFNPDLTGTKFGREIVKLGWDESRLFFHGQSWNELNILTDIISKRDTDNQVILVIDLDGTLLCPRPKYNSTIKDARQVAIARICENLSIDNFSAKSEDSVRALEKCYEEASKSGFSKSYDDEDLTMLICLGLYANIIAQDDDLLNPLNNVGFVTPIEWLQYASFLIENNSQSKYRLHRLKSLFTHCADEIHLGSPTAFADFRKEEEKVLLSGAKSGEIVLNRLVVEFIHDCTRLGAVPIGFSDRPNASLGLVSTSSRAHTASASEEGFFHAPLTLVIP